LPQTSIYYALGRLSVLQQNRLDKTRLERLLQAPTIKDAQRVLSEIGWPEGADYEQSANEHIRSACELIRSITTDKGTMNCFLFRYDINNLKMLFKARLQQIQAEHLAECGTIPVEKLKTCVTEHNYGTLPKPMKETMETLEKRCIVKVDPLEIDIMLDKALYRMVQDTLKEGNITAIRYFTMRIDCLNCIMAIRCANAKRPQGFLKAMLLEGGKVSPSAWLKAYEHPERLPVLLNGYGPKIYNAAIAALLDPKKLTVLEKVADDVQLEVYRPFRASTDQNERVIGYLLMRQREAAAIRLIMTGKTNGFPPEAIQERLRGLYV